MGIAAALMATAGARRVIAEPGVRRRLDGVVEVRRMRRRDEVLGGGWGGRCGLYLGPVGYLGGTGKVYCHCATLVCMVRSVYV